MTRQMVMVGFLQAQNCTNLPSSWRHPQSRDDAHSADYYQEIARVLEAGKFHMAFFDDRLAMPDRYGNDHAHTVEYGIRATKMDPLIVLMTMSAVTTQAGPRLDLLHHLLRAVRRRPPVRHARPDDGRPRGLERRDLGQRRRGPQHGPPGAPGARPALRPGRRVHGGGARALGHVGRRRDHRRQEDRPLRRSRQGEAARPQGQVLHLARVPSPCRARRRAIPSSSRPAPAAAASASPAAGAR